MKLLRFAMVALLAGGVLAACDDDEPVVVPPPPVTPVAPPPPEPVVGSVSGTVSVEGSGLSGVNVGLVGAASQTATTGASGGYSFSNVPGGTHGVQISGFPAEVAFVSTASVVTIATSGQNATADFSGNYIRTSTITGTVTAGTEGVVATVTATGAGMLMSEDPAVGSSDMDGNFELTGLRAGTYHVAISDFPEGIEFPVTTRDVTVGVGLSANVSFSAPGEDTGTDDTGAFVVISKVASGMDTEGRGPHKNNVTVTAQVERGTARFEKIALHVDGVEVDSQDFGTAASAPGNGGGDAELAAQQVFEFDLGFNSAKHDPETGDPDYMNGEHTLSVDVTLTGGETISSNRLTVEFDNDDRYELTLAADGNQASDSDGLVWRSGAVTAKVLPVIYSGAQTISQVTLGLRDADDGSVLISSRGGTDEVDPITDDEAPFEVTWANENANSSNQKRVGGIQPGAIVVHLLGSAYADGTVGPKETPMGDDATDDKPYFLRLDNAGPSVSNINRAMQFNRHYDITNWVGSGHMFTFSSSSTTPDFSDGDGVGRNRSHHQYYAGASTAEDDLVMVSAPRDLDETSNNRAYVLGANVRDLLGNETMVWWAGADNEDGLSNSGTDRGTVDRTDDYKFGVDLTAPTQELVEDDGNIGPAGGVIDNVAITAAAGRRSVEIDYDDPGTGSGFSGSNAPVHTRIRRYAPGLSARAGCISGQAYWHTGGGGACEILGDPGSNQWRANDGAGISGGTTGSYDFEDQEDGYYAVEYAVMDDAGNRAPFIQTGGVIDETAPVGSALVPAARAIGGRSTLQAFASDNLDLDRVEFYLGFGGDAYQMGSESVGSPSLPFEQSANASISIETFPAGVQSAAGAPPPLSAHLVRILDQAGNPTYASAVVTATGDAPRDLLTAFVVETVMAESDVSGDGTIGGRSRSNVFDAQAVEHDLGTNSLCWDVDGDGDCAETSEARATLTFEIDGEGTAADLTGGADGVSLEAEAPGNPFERVVFYVQRDESLTELDGVTTTWAYLGEGRGRAPQDNPDDDDDTADRQFSWRLNVRGADVAEAAGLTAIPGAAVNFRAVGYTDDGTAVTVATNGTITLSDD